MPHWLTIKLARKNNGVMEAEHRLWPFVTCLILVTRVADPLGRRCGTCRALVRAHRGDDLPGV
jgi:hypothetical protein